LPNNERFDQPNGSRKASKSETPNPRSGRLFSPSGHLWLWRPGGTVRVMEKDLVQERGWLTKQEMRDAID